MNAFSFTHYMAARVFAAIALFSLVAGMLPMQAFADNDNHNNEQQNSKVSICHASAHGYSSGKQQVNKSAVLSGEHAHKNHSTGGYNNIGDIIPPFQSGNVSYPGKNWTVQGQAIWNNNCNLPTPPTVDVCSNIPQAQTVIPEGYYADDGECFPNPTCQEGYTGNYPDCVPPPPPQCPQGYTGNYPDCVLPPPLECPQGTTGIYPICTPVATPPSCSDGILNQDETDVDVGGVCGGGDATQLCEVVIVSDASDFVVEKSANAVPLVSPYLHNAWTLLSGASWIWGDSQVIDPTIDETQTFKKQFGFVGNVTSATLTLASDNSHVATLNVGTPHVGALENNFSSSVAYDVTADVDNGNNELVVSVKNWKLDGSTAASNPAGLLYKLVILGEVTTDSDCSTPYVPPTPDNTTITLHKVTNVESDQEFGFYLDQNESTVASLMGGESSDPIVVSAGSHSLSEGSAEGWSLTAVACLDENEEEVAVSEDGAFYLTLASGDDVTCTFTNTKDSVVPPVCGIGENLLVNGSFEDPVADANSYGVGFWEIFPGSIPGWSVSLSSGLELWNNMFGGASDGVQNAELDGDDATRITQTVATTPGATYELRFDFAARTTDATDNSIDVAIDGASILSTSTANTNWATYTKTFVADGSTDVAFTDMGIAQDAGGTGTLLDNAVLCFVRNGEGGGGDQEVDLYRIKGYVWNDDNENAIWDGQNNEDESSDEEAPISGWVVRITNGEETFETTTDADGYYFFDVPAGTWTITEEEQDDWDRTTQESYEVTVPAVPVDPEVTLLDTIVNFVMPTAYAAVIGLPYGDYNFGNNEKHHGGGRHHSGGGRVLGDSDSNVSDEPEPKGLVLGEQVSAVPTGAPDTGKGGAAETLVMGRLLVAPRRFRTS